MASHARWFYLELVLKKGEECQLQAVLGKLESFDVGIPHRSKSSLFKEQSL